MIEPSYYESLGARAFEHIGETVAEVFSSLSQVVVLGIWIAGLVLSVVFLFLLATGKLRNTSGKIHRALGHDGYDTAER